MNDHFLALLVYDRAHPLETLSTVLKELSVETYSVRTCKEARERVLRIRPDLIFTDTCLPDGSWTDVVDMAGRSDSPVNVIVVSATEDVQLYISALERGAFGSAVIPVSFGLLLCCVHRLAALDPTADRQPASNDRDNNEHRHDISHDR
jgi:DNA-binding NtrC family response regulator